LVRVAASVGLDVGRPDHLAPFLSFVGDELPKVSRGAGERCAAQIDKPGLDRGISEGSVDLFVERVNNLSRRVFRLRPIGKSCRVGCGGAGP
jgi:hypothetical protein